METPVDLVYLWVDGSDPRHQHQRRLCSKERPQSDANTTGRFRSAGEVYASIASALFFAPFLQTIYVLIDDCQEDLFDNQWGDRVQVVPHSVVYAESGHLHHLPTFNSQSLETHLHLIPGLAEHFLYANDDTFFGSPVTVSTFFNPEGQPRVAYAKSLMPVGRPSVQSQSFHWSRLNNVQLLNQWSRVHRPRHEWIHQIRPLRKQFLLDAWQEPLFRKALERTSGSKFRSMTDVEPVGLVLHWKTEQGETEVTRLRTRTFYVDDHCHLPELFDQINQGRYDLYCLNDGMQYPSEQQWHMYCTLLKTQLPHHCPEPLLWSKKRPTPRAMSDQKASMGRLG